MRLLIAVTHLLGTGHLSRALTLGRAFAQAGHEVLVVSGGLPAPQFDSSGLNVLNLPPLRSDGVDFTRLLDEQGQPATPALMAHRSDALVTALRSFAPDVVMTELFPFGRRILRDEFTALLDAACAQPRAPLMLSSVRDILAPPSKPAKAAQAEALIERYYDAVLVHSDPTVTALEVSWPVTPAIAAKLRYTGYVAPPPAGPHPRAAGDGEILVSAGGGSVGTPIYQAAVRAAAQTPDLRWRLLVGGRDAADRITALQIRVSSPNITLEPARSDFRKMLNHATASVSMCGYNTALDLMQAGTPSVIIPFDDGSEVEQSLRAGALAHLPATAILRNADLTPDALAVAVRQVAAQGRRPASGIEFDGAANSVTIVETLLKERP